MKTITRRLLSSAVGACLAIPSFAQTFEDHSGQETPLQPLGAERLPVRVETLRFAEAAGAEKDDQRVSRSANTRGKQRFDALEEVIVTAQKRVERLIEVPMSITAVSAEELSARGINNVRDLSYAVPSLSVLESGPGRQIITIRGMAGQRGNSSLTGLYLDEAPLAGMQDGFVASYIDLQPIDLERVEVLKGPQGTLFGEGGAGGVIRFITKDPDLNLLGGDVGTELYSTADGGWSQGLTGVLNLPLAKDALGIRVAAKYENIAGWIDQPSIGREDINDSEVKHVRGKALFVPTPELRIKGMVEIHRNDGGGSNIVNQEPLSDSNFRQAAVLDAPTGYTDDHEIYNLTGTYGFRFAELLSSTSYAESDSRQSFTQLTSEQPVPFLEIVADYVLHAKIVSQEFRFTSLGAGPLNWTIGANYKDSELRSGRGPGGNSLILNGGTARQLTLIGASPNFEGAQTSESWAGFADASYRFASRIEIGGGLRYFYDERESYGTRPPSVALSGNFDKTTYRAYARYEFSKDANIYLTVGTGFRTGGFNSAFAVSRGAPPDILPENSLFYELGTKLSLLDGGLHFEGAIFYGEYQDMMASRSQPSTVDQIPVQYTANGQGAEIKGVECNIAWAATNQLTLTVAADVTDTEITEVDPTDLAPVYFLGDPISLVPEYTVSANVDYTFQFSESMPGFFRVGFNRKGKQFNTERTNVFILDHQTVTPELNFLDASLGGEWNSWRWSVFGRNLLDEDGFLYPTVSGWSAQARPRTVGVALSKTF